MRGLSGWEGPRSDQGRSSAEDEGEGKPERQQDGEELCCRGSAKSHSGRALGSLGRAGGGTGTTLPREEHAGPRRDFYGSPMCVKPDSPSKFYR